MIRKFFLGFIKVHILPHASKEAIYGLWIIDELSHHGYNLSPGTLSPIFHTLEEKGFLKSREKLVNGKIRKYYQTTQEGVKVLGEARLKIKALVDEVL